MAMFRNKMQQMMKGPTAEEQRSKAIEKDATVTEKLMKAEAPILSCLTIGRNLYIERRIEGSIEIGSSFGGVSHAVDCSIEEEDFPPPEYSSSFNADEEDDSMPVEEEAVDIDKLGDGDEGSLSRMQRIVSIFLLYLSISVVMVVIFDTGCSSDEKCN